MGSGHWPVGPHPGGDHYQTFLASRPRGAENKAIAEVIAADTGADPERALLLAAALTGLSETSARWWLPRKGTVSRDEAVALISALAWRGISGFPRIDGDQLPS